MRPQPFVNKFLRTTILNSSEENYHLAVKIMYEGPRLETPIESIYIHSSPVIAFNYNLGYESSSELLPALEDGYIRPISMFNMSGHDGLWSDIHVQNSIIDKNFVVDEGECFWSAYEYYQSSEDFIDQIRKKYNWNGYIGSDLICLQSESLENNVKKKTETEKAAESIMEILDKNSEKLPEGDYLKICDVLKKIRNL